MKKKINSGKKLFISMYGPGTGPALAVSAEKRAVHDWGTVAGLQSVI